MWKKSGINGVDFLKDGMVVAWLSTFQGKKISSTTKFDVNTSREDWKESERIQT